MKLAGKKSISLVQVLMSEYIYILFEEKEKEKEKDRFLIRAAYLLADAAVLHVGRCSDFLIHRSQTNESKLERDLSIMQQEL